MENRDFKYVMMDSGNLYLGARLSYREVLEEEMCPFKMKTIITRYLITEHQEESSIESILYYLDEGSFEYQVFEQLRIKIKVMIRSEKKGLFQKNKLVFGEKLLSLKELVALSENEKKSRKLLITEMVVPKLSLMSFSV